MFVAFDGLGGGIGCVLVGGVVAVCSVFVMILFPEVLSLSCWFMVMFSLFDIGMNDGLGSGLMWSLTGCKYVSSGCRV